MILLKMLFYIDDVRIGVVTYSSLHQFTLIYRRFGMIAIYRLFIVVFSVLSIGCASTLVTHEQYSGYLSDYSPLKATNTPSGGVTLRWISKEIAEKGYHSVILDKSVLYPEPKSSAQVSEMVLQQLSWTLDKAMNDAAKGTFNIVKNPGEGVLRIRPAITGVVHSMESMQPIEILPIALVLGVGKAVAGTRDRDVDVFLEVEVIDSQTGELLAAAVRKGEGAQLENDTAQLTMVHLSDMVKRWEEDASEIFKDLSQ